jgi:tetratricopeptide (TPR) repeat protein
VKIARITFFAAVTAYLLLIIPFTTHLKNLPLQLKVGYVPEAKVLKFITADQRYLVADFMVLKVLFYFGSLIEKAEGKNLAAFNPDYPGMFRMLQTALRLEPYNADAYYFAQAAFTWEVGRYKEVNNMLDYGMKYRTWDYQLPFFAGFNAAYFMKDYKKAAEYMKKAAELAHEQQYATLAARYFYEAGETEFGILFLKTMKSSANDANEKKLYEFRLKALLAVKSIEDAVKLYQRKLGRSPVTIAELLSTGFLASVPQDPYGGKFYLDKECKVRSTSKLSFADAKEKSK